MIRKGASGVRSMIVGPLLVFDLAASASPPLGEGPAEGWGGCRVCGAWSVVSVFPTRVAAFTAIGLAALKDPLPEALGAERTGDGIAGFPGFRG